MQLPHAQQLGFFRVCPKAINPLAWALVGMGLMVAAGSARAAELTTLAGSTNGSADGPAIAAQFDGPSGVAVDREGSIYIADSGNHRIRKLEQTPRGWVVRTFAGSTRGTRDGAAGEAQFNYPTGVAVDRSGTVYVAEYYGHRIRKICPNGDRSTVTTVAGSTSGFADGPAAVARFKNPAGVAIDAAGNLLVADRNNERVRKISFETDGAKVTTIAGSGIAGFSDGPASTAQFNDPMGVAVDRTGNIYVADRSNHRVRKITLQAKGAFVSTIAGSKPGFADGSGAKAQFDAPYGIAVDDGGAVLVVDSMNNRIRTVSFGVDGPIVTTLAGNGRAGSVDGQAKQGQLNYPNGVAIDGVGDVLVAEDGGDRIRRVSSR